jgi:hypothetical protein
VTRLSLCSIQSFCHQRGHGLTGVRLSVARANEGVSSNDLTDEEVVDPLSGNAVLNSVPVSIEPVVARYEEFPDGSPAQTRG